MKYFLLITVLGLSTATYASDSKTKLRVAVASNFLATLSELKTVFEKNHEVKILLSGASSAKLYAQIENGAPYDIFFSADTMFPEKLIKNGKADSESRFNYAIGSLVLWSSNSQVDVKEKLESHQKVKRIAIANPKVAPYGEAAKQTMEKLGVWKSYKRKTVYGESVGQAFQFVATGNAQLGFVALSQVLSPMNQINRKRYWLVPSSYHTPLDQEVVILKRTKNSIAAKQFLSFIKSDDAKSIMDKYGYR